MCPITKNGVCYDLAVSPFRVKTDFFEYFFSSAKHLEKFVSLLETRREWLDDSLSRRFHVRINSGVLSELQLYMQVETRGFHIVDKSGEVFTCRENIRLDGLKPNGGGSTLP